MMSMCAASTIQTDMKKHERTNGAASKPETGHEHCDMTRMGRMESAHHAVLVYCTSTVGYVTVLVRLTCII